MIRGEGKIKYDYYAKDAYEIYKESSHNSVNRSTFNKIIKDFNLALLDEIILNNFEFKLPYLGMSLRVKKKKVKIRLTSNGTLDNSKLNIDYNATWKMWRRLYPNKTDEEIVKIPNKKRVYHTNEHTGGYSYKFYLSKDNCTTRNKSIYSFKPSRFAKRYLASQLKTNKEIDFFE